MGLVKWKNNTISLTYNSWRSMRNRILFDSSINHKFYKDKGITICDRWIDSFDNFVEDMGERPEGTTLDRIDSKGNYTKENCRWASHREQQNNKDSLTRIEYEGETRTIGEWCYILDLTATEKSKAYKRHSTYNCKTYEELFCNHLSVLKTSKRVNKCSICNRLDSCKWRKDGRLCNTCYCRAYKWAQANSSNIEDYKEWENKF